MNGSHEDNNLESAGARALEDRLYRCSHRIGAPDSLYHRLDLILEQRLGSTRLKRKRLRAAATLVAVVLSILTGYAMLYDDPLDINEHTAQDQTPAPGMETTKPVGMPPVQSP